MKPRVPTIQVDADVVGGVGLGVTFDTGGLPPSSLGEQAPTSDDLVLWPTGDHRKPLSVEVVGVECPDGLRRWSLWWSLFWWIIEIAKHYPDKLRRWSLWCIFVVAKHFLVCYTHLHPPTDLVGLFTDEYTLSSEGLSLKREALCSRHRASFMFNCF
jgi:hypothetical protein